MRSYLINCLLLLPVLANAGDNSFLPQDPKQLGQQNQQVKANIMQYTQEAERKAQVQQQSASSTKALQTILYSSRATLSANRARYQNNNAPDLQPPGQPKKAPQYVPNTDVASPNTATGFSKNQSKDSNNQSSGWNYSY